MSEAGRRFRQHYTRAEAEALLPEVRAWLRRLRELHPLLTHHGGNVERLLRDGRDAGGPEVNHWVRGITRAARTLQEFERREIQVKDIERGLVDFPAILAGREVFLCWEEGEEEIGYWHELDGGYAGRSAL
ncbi:MAG: DUF2203 domain-containing protein [Verrucomicrobiales bacterium]|nr:DUF2203 domain-containing protein [Verrucomicrobiales bacterium]